MNDPSISAISGSAFFGQFNPLSATILPRRFAAFKLAPYLLADPTCVPAMAFVNAYRFSH